MGSPRGDGHDSPVNSHGDHDRCLDVPVGNGGVGVRLGGSENEVEAGRHKYGEDGAAGVAKQPADVEKRVGDHAAASQSSASSRESLEPVSRTKASSRVVVEMSSP